MGDLLGWFEYGFAQRALVAGLLVALLGAVVGFFVVLRRMAFVAVGISHAALGGVALGVLVGQSPVVWAIGFSIVVALGMSALGRRGLSEDTAMGVFFPAAMAFGVIVISFSQNWQRDLLSYLFGNILGVSAADLWILGGTTLLVLLVIALFFKELLYISFDEESAHASGVPVATTRTLLLVVTAVTVVVSIKVVGTVLVSALLVIPAATMAQVTGRWQWMLGGSALIGVASLLTGFVISFSSTKDVATAPAAVLVATALFGLASVGARVVETRRQAATSPPAPAGPAPLRVEE